ncbi:MAG: hypothetical protein ACYC55_01890 [Candidatus Geothermincolia bacterium]
MSWQAPYIRFEKWGQDLNGFLVFDRERDKGTLLASIIGSFPCQTRENGRSAFKKGDFFLATESNSNSFKVLPFDIEVDKGEFLLLPLGEWLKHCRFIRTVCYNVHKIDGIINKNDLKDEVDRIAEKITTSGEVNWLSSFTLPDYPVLIGRDIQAGLKASSYKFKPLWTD